MSYLHSDQAARQWLDAVCQATSGSEGPTNQRAKARRFMWSDSENTSRQAGLPAPPTLLLPSYLPTQAPTYPTCLPSIYTPTQPYLLTYPPTYLPRYLSHPISTWLYLPAGLYKDVRYPVEFLIIDLQVHQSANSGFPRHW